MASDTSREIAELVDAVLEVDYWYLDVALEDAEQSFRRDGEIDLAEQFQRLRQAVRGVKGL